MILPLLRREIKANAKLLLLFLAIITMYAGVIVAMYDPALGESLRMMAKSMPELFAAFGMQDPGATLIEFVANYLFGFIMIVIPFLFCMILITRLISRYVDKGSMAYLLATPHKRAAVIRTQYAVLYLFLVFMIVYEMGVVWIGSELLFDEPLQWKPFLMLNVGLLCVHLLFAGIGCFFACICNETKEVLLLAGGIGMVFILVQMLSQVGEKMEWLSYLTPLTLFDTKKLIALDEKALAYVCVLGLVGVLLQVIGTMIFKKRDLAL